MTERLLVDPRAPQPDRIARAAARLRAGDLVAFPTETVYGLGVDATNVAAIRRLFAAKQRPFDDPLIVHLAGDTDLASVALDPPAEARALARVFWPGPLTLVLRRAPSIPPEVAAGGDTVAVRVPAHPVAQALLRAAGLPVAAPSANLFSRPSPTSAAHVLEDLDGRIDMVLDAGTTPIGVESTVLDLTTTPPRVLRPGAVTLAMLREVMPSVAGVAERQAREDAGVAHAAHSPGLLEKHYSPRAPLTVYDGARAAVLERLAADAAAAAREGRRVGVLVPGDEAEAFRGKGWIVVELGDTRDIGAIAARLYAALRELDQHAVDVILACGVTERGGLADAVRDRLRRAAAGHVVSV